MALLTCLWPSGDKKANTSRKKLEISAMSRLTPLTAYKKNEPPGKKEVSWLAQPTLTHQ